jgi:uncharacterized protein YcnI
MKIPVLIMTLVVSTLPLAASAHVTVTPAEVPISSFQTFTVSVPNEKTVGTIALRLEVPAGLERVTPTVKPGWTISTKKDANGVVTEISWTGGRIPAERRDEFTFSAKVPAEESKIAWKAHQSYADGTIVAWTMDPNMAHEDDFSTSGPYSVTKVINDLGSAPGYSNLRASELASFVLAAVALVVAGLALARTRKHPHHPHKHVA